MKIKITESQYDLLKSLKEESQGQSNTYVAKFEILIDAVNDAAAVAKLEIMKNQISDATRNAEVFPSLYEKAPFGGEPKRIK